MTVNKLEIIHTPKSLATDMFELLLKSTYQTVVEMFIHDLPVNVAVLFVCPKADMWSCMASAYFC